MSNVFLSYVREDSNKIDIIYHELSRYGMTVWLDKHSISPGQRWKDAIRRAIRNGDYFIACFSSAYLLKQKTYMNEELYLAIDELRMRPADQAWFIPLKLDECKIPDRSIGAGETLSDIQFIDMHKNWDEGINALVRAINPNEDYFMKVFLDADLSLREQFLSMKNNRYK